MYGLLSNLPNFRIADHFVRDLSSATLPEWDGLGAEKKQSLYHLKLLWEGLERVGES